MCFCQWYGDPQDLHVRTRSFPTRLSSDLAPSGRDGPARSDRPLGEFQGVVADVVAPYLLAQIVLGQQALIQAFTHERSEEHTSELQSLMRISYAVFCLKKKKHTT